MSVQQVSSMQRDMAVELVPEMMPPQTPNQDNTIKKTLFNSAMKGKWETVVSIYTENKWVQAEKITRSEDTVLHVAVSDGKEDIVKQLVDAVDPTNPRRILEQENEKGNTPLHLAAALGMAQACAAMANKCPSLIVKAHNKRGETPLFLAAKYGKKSAFFALQAAIETKPEILSLDKLSYCRRPDGDTILHVAINAEHFELAFEIIYLYENLVKYNNERGETALHCLANKPHVFKSGSRYGLLDKVIYSCTFVDPLTVKYPKVKGKIQSDALDKKGASEKLPENYKICFEAFKLLKHVYGILVSTFEHRSVKKCYIAQEEGPDERLMHSRPSNEDLIVNSQELGETSAIQSEQAKDVNGSSKKRMFPENYKTCFDLFQVAMKTFLVILGIGLWRTQEIGKKKKKHIYACQIMDELVTRSLSWEYGKGGKKPEQKPLLASEVNLPTDTPSTDDQEKDGYSSPNQINNSKLDEQATMSKEPPKETSIAMATMDGATMMLKAPKGSTTEMVKNIVDSFSKQQGMDPKNIVILGMDQGTSTKEPDGVTPILVAAKRGVTEMIEKILDNFPVAVQDMDSNDKNIVLLAVEHRQPNVFQLMLKRNIMKESIFNRVDKDGNSAVHLAATLGHDRPWIIPGAALQMQWEIKWYKYVLKSMMPEFYPQYNNSGQTAREIFTIKHEQLVKDGGSWLNSTSQSCSVVAALIATVAFASATTVPGGINQNSGFPTLEGQPAFEIFALSALVALCFSVTSLIMFLAILTSRYQEWDFENDLPVKLILGLTSLFMSITAMLVSFCAGHFFVVEKKLKYVTYPIYAVMCLPVTFFAAAQLPLYVDLIKATFVRVPQRTEKMRAL